MQLQREAASFLLPYNVSQLRMEKQHAGCFSVENHLTKPQKIPQQYPEDTICLNPGELKYEITIWNWKYSAISTWKYQTTD